MRERHGEMGWATRIQQALDEDRLELFHQRILPLRGEERDLHAEVLVRLREADGTLVLPGAFLPAAERFHLAARIDAWVLRKVVRWLAAEDVSRIALLSVNLSGQSVGDRAFHRWAMELLGTLPRAALRRLCLDVTETAAVTNMADAASFITQVRGLGVRVALDDFGAGASSFGYLKSLAVDFIKIDGQFVRDLLDDPLDRAAVSCFAAGYGTLAGRARAFVGRLIDAGRRQARGERRLPMRREPDISAQLTALLPSGHG